MTYLIGRFTEGCNKTQNRKEDALMKKLFALLLALTMMLSVSMVSAETLECDVVVVGGGGAGMSAALSAAENGAKVILIEKQGYLGGATMMSAASYQPLVPNSRKKPVSKITSNGSSAILSVRPTMLCVKIWYIPLPKMPRPLSNGWKAWA